MGIADHVWSVEENSPGCCTKRFAMSVESTLSYWVRRGAAIIALVAVPVMVAAILLGNETVGTYAFLVAWMLPYAVMISHLNLTKVLSRDEKTVWREQLWSRVGSFIAVWAYLFATDLGERGRGFRPWSTRTK